MDYLRDLETFYEDVKKGLEEIGEHSPQSQEEELEAMNRRVKLVRPKCFVLLEKMADLQQRFLQDNRSYFQFLNMNSSNMKHEHLIELK